MKLRKILASFLAGAVALTSAVFTATAEDRLPLVTWTVEAAGTASDTYEYTVDPAIASSVASLELAFDEVTTDYLQVGVIVDAGYSDSNSDWQGNYNGAYLDATITGSTASLTVDFAANGLAYRAEDTKTNLILKGNWLNPGSASLESVIIKDSGGNTLVTLLGDVADTTEYGWQTLEVPTVDEYGNYYFPGYFITENISGPNAGIEIVTIDNDSSWGGFNIVNNESGWTKISGDYGDTTTGTLTDFVKFSSLTGDLPTTGGNFIISTYGGATLSSVRIKNAVGKDPVYVVPAPTYTIEIADPENGSVVAKVDGATATEAEEGATVTLEITPDAGYEIDTIIASDDNGDDFVSDFISESNTFVMPAENVTIKVTFMPIEVQSVDVTPENVTLVVGDSIQLVAEVTPTDALDQTLTWSSDEPTIASVDQNGKVTALEEGFAVITAKASNGVLNTVTVNVTTESVPATAIELISTELDTVVGDMNNIGAGLSIEPADCTDVPVWTTSDPDVATVTADGKVTSVGAGEATITVTVGSLTATCVVNVEEPAPEPSGFDLTEPEFKLNIATMQTAIEDDGEKSLRFVCMKPESDLEGVSQVDFELRLYVDGEFYGATTISSEYYYTSLVASGETVTAPEGCVFIAITINNVPATHDIECYRITY